MKTIPNLREPGSFRWQTDPNYQEPAPTPIAPVVPVQARSNGASWVDLVIAASEIRNGRKTKRSATTGKGAAAVTDAVGSIAGAFDSDAGNQIQSRAAGMRMKGDPAQAQAARDAYVQAFNATDDETLKQQFADTAANISKGSNMAIPDAVQSGSTVAGTMAEGASKAIPLLVGLGISGLKDGGAVRDGRGGDDEARAQFSRIFNQPG